jgi:hypothetical protein
MYQHVIVHKGGYTSIRRLSTLTMIIWLYVYNCIRLSLGNVLTI